METIGETLKDFPFTIHLTLTRQCNLNCLYCTSDPFYSHGEMSTQDWFDAIDQITADYGRVSMVIKGGEPMTREDFFVILAHVKSKGHTISLVTNGTFIHDMTTARQLEKYVDNIEISLDGVSSETTDAIKGKGMFKRVMAGVKRVQQTRMKLGLSFVVLPENQAILGIALDEFMQTQAGEKTDIRIDNRISFPVPPKENSWDLFDFLREKDKLACHGRLGLGAASAGLEIDAFGFVHPYSPDFSGIGALRP